MRFAMTAGAKSSDQSRARSDLMRIFAAAVSAVEPRRAVARVLAGEIAGSHAIADAITQAPKVRMLAAGKCAAAMAAGIAEALGERLTFALVIAPKDAPPSIEIGSPPRILHAAHPLPDASSVAAGLAALEFAAATAADELFLLALSGGASALMVAPAAGVTLADKIAITSALMRAGASIRELNAVRKHLSAIKGGGLLRALPAQAHAAALIISDVAGDDLATIGSGPMAADPTTFSDAIGVLKRRRLWGRAPESVRDHLERGAAGEIAETLKSSDPRCANALHLIVAANRDAVAGAARAAEALGYRVELTRELAGEADEVGRALARRIAGIKEPRVCVIAGGEPVVTVRGAGQGGRAQQCALAIAIELAKLAPRLPALAMCAGTDGIDGPTDAAGAIATPATVARGAEAGFDASATQARNDAYPLFRGLGDLVITGPTGANVADIFIALVNY
jgi:glycerate 2-kinase